MSYMDSWLMIFLSLLTTSMLVSAEEGEGNVVGQASCVDQNAFERYMEDNDKIAKVNVTEESANLNDVIVEYLSCHDGDSIPWADTLLPRICPLYPDGPEKPPKFVFNVEYSPCMGNFALRRKSDGNCVQNSNVDGFPLLPICTANQAAQFTYSDSSFGVIRHRSSGRVLKPASVEIPLTTVDAVDATSEEEQKWGMYHSKNNCICTSEPHEEYRGYKWCLTTTTTNNTAYEKIRRNESCTTEWFYNQWNNSRCFSDDDCDFKTVNLTSIMRSRISCRQFNTSRCDVNDPSQNCGCQAIESCPPPPPAGDHAVMLSSTIDEDSVTTRVVYGCEADYLPLNETVVQCVRGAYNGSGLLCSKVCNLGNDTIPANSHITYRTGPEYAVVVHVECDDGYSASVNINSTSVCSDGVFTAFEFTCERNCQPPPDYSSHGVKLISITGEVYNRTVTYGCNDLYYSVSLVAQVSLKCAGGLFPDLGDLLVCSRKCGEPPQPERGLVVTKNDSYVSYKCEPNHIKVYGDNGTCNAGSWASGVGIICIAPCSVDNIPTGNNSTYTETSTARGELVVVYTCLDGYHPKKGFLDPHRLECIDDSWNTQAEKVEPLTCLQSCPSLTTPVGALILNHTYYEISYSCLSGYIHTEGNLTLACVSAAWSGRLPVCKKTCEPAPSGIQALQTTTGPEHAQTTVYSCPDAHHTSKGWTDPYILTCSEGEYNSTTGLTCEADCGAPPDLHQITWSVDLYTSNGTCTAAYDLIGPSSLHCVNGSWSGEMPSCIKHCSVERLPAVHNSSHITEGDQHNLTVTYSCTPGFALYNNISTILCYNDTIAGDVPQCLAICLEPMTPVNTRPPSSEGASYNKTYTFICMTGFYTVPNEPYKVSCYNGSYRSDTNMTCRDECELTTSDMLQSENVVIDEIQATSTSIYKVKVSCRDGYAMSSGGDEVNCERGMLTKANIPTCLPVCPDPPEIQNSIQAVSGEVYSRIVSYTCMQNFAATTTNQQSTCVNGTYSDLDLECKQRCPDPLVPPHSQLNQSGNATYYTTTFECDTNYTIVRGDSSVNCSEGIKRGIEPVCGIFCQAPPNVTDSSRIVTVIERNNIIVRYTCSKGCVLTQGDLTLRCIDGMYIGCTPVCTPLCPDPPTISNTSRALDGEPHAITARYQCQGDMVKFSGDELLKCENGRYIGDELVCVKPCSVLKSDTHLNCSSNEIQPYAVAYNCSCRPGMLKLPNTAESFSCVNGTFDAIPLKCEPECEEFINDRTNMTCSVSGEAYAREVSCQCKEGYHHTGGDSTRSCDHGKFLGAAMECTPECPLQLSITEGTCQFSGNVSNAVYTCVCNTGYELENSHATVHCMLSVFSDSRPSCVPLSTTTIVAPTIRASITTRAPTTTGALTTTGAPTRTRALSTTRDPTTATTPKLSAEVSTTMLLTQVKTEMPKLQRNGINVLKPDTTPDQVELESTTSADTTINPDEVETLSTMWKRASLLVSSTTQNSLDVSGTPTEQISTKSEVKKQTTTSIIGDEGEILLSSRPIVIGKSTTGDMSKTSDSAAIVQEQTSTRSLIDRFTTDEGEYHKAKTTTHTLSTTGAEVTTVSDELKEKLHFSPNPEVTASSELNSVSEEVMETITATSPAVMASTDVLAEAATVEASIPVSSTKKPEGTTTYSLLQSKAMSTATTGENESTDILSKSNDQKSTNSHLVADTTSAILPSTEALLASKRLSSSAAKTTKDTLSTTIVYTLEDGISTSGSTVGQSDISSVTSPEPAPPKKLDGEQSTDSKIFADIETIGTTPIQDFTRQISASTMTSAKNSDTVSTTNGLTTTGVLSTTGVSDLISSNPTRTMSAETTKRDREDRAKSNTIKSIFTDTVTTPQTVSAIMTSANSLSPDDQYTVVTGGSTDIPSTAGISQTAEGKAATNAESAADLGTTSALLSTIHGAVVTDEPDQSVFSDANPETYAYSTFTRPDSSAKLSSITPDEVLGADHKTITNQAVATGRRGLSSMLAEPTTQAEPNDGVSTVITVPAIKEAGTTTDTLMADGTTYEAIRTSIVPTRPSSSQNQPLTVEVSPASSVQTTSNTIFTTDQQVTTASINKNNSENEIATAAESVTYSQTTQELETDAISRKYDQTEVTETNVDKETNGASTGAIFDPGRKTTTDTIHTTLTRVITDSTTKTDGKLTEDYSLTMSTNSATKEMAHTASTSQPLVDISTNNAISTLTPDARKPTDASSLPTAVTATKTISETTTGVVSNMNDQTATQSLLGLDTTAEADPLPDTKPMSNSQSSTSDTIIDEDVTEPTAEASVAVTTDVPTHNITPVHPYTTTVKQMTDGTQGVFPTTNAHIPYETTATYSLPNPTLETNAQSQVVTTSPTKTFPKTSNIAFTTLTGSLGVRKPTTDANLSADATQVYTSNTASVTGTAIDDTSPEAIVTATKSSTAAVFEMTTSGFVTGDIPKERTDDNVTPLMPATVGASTTKTSTDVLQTSVTESDTQSFTKMSTKPAKTRSLTPSARRTMNPESTTRDILTKVEVMSIEATTEDTATTKETVTTTNVKTNIPALRNGHFLSYTEESVDLDGVTTFADSTVDALTTNLPEQSTDAIAAEHTNEHVHSSFSELETSSAGYTHSIRGASVTEDGTTITESGPNPVVGMVTSVESKTTSPTYIPLYDSTVSNAATAADMAGKLKTSTESLSSLRTTSTVVSRTDLETTTIMSQTAATTKPSTAVDVDIDTTSNSEMETGDRTDERSTTNVVLTTQTNVEKLSMDAFSQATTKINDMTITTTAVMSSTDRPVESVGLISGTDASTTDALAKTYTKTSITTPNTDADMKTFNPTATDFTDEMADFETTRDELEAKTSGVHLDEIFTTTDYLASTDKFTNTAASATVDVASSDKKVRSTVASTTNVIMDRVSTTTTDYTLSSITRHADPIDAITKAAASTTGYILASTNGDAASTASITNTAALTTDYKLASTIDPVASTEKGAVNREVITNTTPVRTDYTTETAMDVISSTAGATTDYTSTTTANNAIAIDHITNTTTSTTDFTLASSNNAATADLVTSASTKEDAVDTSDPLFTFEVETTTLGRSERREIIDIDITTSINEAEEETVAPTTMMEKTSISTTAELSEVVTGGTITALKASTTPVDDSLSHLTQTTTPTTAGKPKGPGRRNFVIHGETTELSTSSAPTPSTEKPSTESGDVVEETTKALGRGLPSRGRSLTINQQQSTVNPNICRESDRRHHFRIGDECYHCYLAKFLRQHACTH